MSTNSTRTESRRLLPAALLAVALLTSPSLASEPGPLEVVYFYSPTCMDCKEAKPFVDAAEKEYAQRITLIRYDVQTNEGLEKLLAFEAAYDAAQGPPPKVFVGNRQLVGPEAIESRLDSLIATQLGRLYAKRSGALPDEQQASHPGAHSDGRGLIERKFSTLSIPAIGAAGLIDGINPCAFATIVFLISVLGKLGKKRHEVLVVGATFSVAVFVTYLLVGIGLLTAIKAIAIDMGFATGLVIAIAIFTMILALWSLWDGIRIWRTGKMPKMHLGLPKSITKRIHRIMKSGFKTRNLILGTLAVGFIVSLLESFCTGQIYVPTIMLVLRTPGSRLDAFGYLVLYNLMFITPLLIVIAVTYWGVGSKHLRDFAMKHLALSKFLMAGLFFGLAGLLLWTV
jgi:thiol-disulfide isomerase/thioredoxin